MSATRLPPWPARNATDNWRMLYWLCDLLDPPEEAYRVVIGPPDEGGDRRSNIKDLLPYAIERAEHGDVEPLRATLASLNPGIARFVNLPRLKRGARWPVHELDLDVEEDMDRVATAAGDVARIRAIWREHYGRRRRRSSDGWSAEKFSALRWCRRRCTDPDDPDVVSLETQIINHLKKHKPIVTDDVIVMKKSRRKARR